MILPLKIQQEKLWNSECYVLEIEQKKKPIANSAHKCLLQEWLLHCKKKERCVHLKKEISLMERQLSAIQNGVTRV